MGVAYMLIASEVIVQALRLPADTDLMGSIDSGDARVVKVLVEHPSIPVDAVMIKGVFEVIHGVTVFDRFEVVKSKPLPCATCGNAAED